jgi:UPF0176 protein
MHDGGSEMEPMRYLNISAYRFIELDGLEEKRERLKDILSKTSIRGTILLGHEGINLFLAGPEAEIRAFIPVLATEVTEIQPKESWSNTIPFRRLLIKIKQEIVTMGVKEISPVSADQQAPYIKPIDLKKWYDEGKEFLILDTRNDYEVELGTFENAVHFDIRTFREFPERAKALLETHKDKTIVTFCTGGIRCEKAAPLMQQMGFEDIYQLDGGIIKYFEDVGGDHYKGECFVFDNRVAVDPELNETKTIQCFICRMPISVEEQSSPLYEYEVSCPKCFGKTKRSAGKQPSEAA